MPDATRTEATCAKGCCVAEAVAAAVARPRQLQGAGTNGSLSKEHSLGAAAQLTLRRQEAAFFW